MTVTLERVEYLLLLDGVPTAFTTSEDVDDAYVATLGAFTSAHPGLALPRGLPDALDLTTGLLGDTTATLQISDVDGSLAALFGSSTADADELLAELKPGETALSTEFDKHVGTELIGPAGERRQCSCIPGWGIGLHHFSSTQSYTFGLGATPVSDTPLVWPGRRCALYRLVQSSSGTWPDLTNATARAAALCWWGTLLGQGTQSEHVWTLRCAGRESWPMGTIGVGQPKEPLRVQALLELDPDKSETLMRASLQLVNLHNPEDVLHDYVTILQDDAALEGLTNYADIAAAVDTFLGQVAADGGSPFEDAGNSDLRFSTTAGFDGVIVRWDREEDSNWVGGPWYTARLNLMLHEKVWKLLGYEPSVQNSERDPIENEDQYGQFYPSSALVPGLWHGKFYAANAAAMLAMEEGDTSDVALVPDDYVNGAAERRWPPIYPGGCQVLDMDVPGQEIQLITTDPLFLIGNNAVPLMAKLDSPTEAYAIGGSVGDVTHTGIMAFRGPYRREGDEDTTKAPVGYAFGIEREREEGRTVQVARVCWRAAADGSVAIDTDYPRIVIYEWLDPRLYGINYDRLTGQWASWRDAPENAVETTARPLLCLEHSREGDSLPLTYAMLLASTGTFVSWYTDSSLLVFQYGLGGSPDAEVGANDLGLDGIGDEKLGLWVDMLPAQLGRGIPAPLIASTADMQSSIEQALADYADGNLYRCKVTATEPFSVRRMLAELLAPTGLCMSLAGGKYGLFDPWTFRAPVDTGVVTSEDYAVEPGDPLAAIPQQTLRKLSPIDKLELSASRDPTAGTFGHQATIGATDHGAPYRAMTMPRPITASYLVHPGSTAKGANWRTEFVQRWNRGFEFWGSQHFEIKFTVAARRFSEFEVGSIVSITDEWVVNPVGIYGVSQAPGFVVSRLLNPSAETCEVTAIVSTDALVLYSPAAQMTRYDNNEDGEGYRLFCEDDMFGCRNGASFDVQGFAEPDWSTAGGNALIEGFAFDGVTWTRGIFGTVDSVNFATPGSTYIKLTGALTGATVRRDMWHVFVLRDEANQSAAWVPEVFAPLCDKDGTSNGTLGTKWRG
jgi:hypothetical protein